MSAESESPVRPSPTAARGALVRRGSVIIIVLILVESVIGQYVASYVTVPKADHDAGLGSAISNGPATLSIHAVLGLVLALGALNVVVQTIRARHWVATGLSAVGLFTVAWASVAGTQFTDSGDEADSVAMAVMTGIALLCYAAILYVLRSRSER